jgi:hypothetical protein
VVPKARNEPGGAGDADSTGQGNEAPSGEIGENGASPIPERTDQPGRRSFDGLAVADVRFNSQSHPEWQRSDEPIYR